MRNFFIRLTTFVGTVVLIGFAMPKLFPDIAAAASKILAGILWISDVAADVGFVLYEFIQWLGGDGVSVIVAGLLAFAGIPWTLRNNARLQREVIQQQYENQAKLENIRFVMERRKHINDFIYNISRTRGEVRSLITQLKKFCEQPTHQQFTKICRNGLWNKGKQSHFVGEANEFAFNVTVPIRTIVLTTLTAEFFLSTIIEETPGNTLPNIDKIKKLEYYVWQIDDSCDRAIKSLYETLRIADLMPPQAAESVTHSHCE